MTHEIKVGQHGDRCECHHCSNTHYYKEVKEPPFVPEYFSGLNWREAEKLIGKKVECSMDGESWDGPFTLKRVSKQPTTIRRFDFDDCCIPQIYIRTVLETHDSHPTITIGGVELPKPETEAPEEGTEYWVHLITGGLEVDHWSGCQFELDILAQGRVHLTENRAQVWADWWTEAVVEAL